jgi:membrane protease YdiL (CAAX protease family)
MQKEPLIKSGWLRAVVFLILFLAVVIFSTRVVMVISVIEKQNQKRGTGIGITQETLLYISLLLTSFLSWLFVFLFRKLVDKQSLRSLGLSFNGYSAHAFSGLLLAPVLLGTGTLLLILNNNLQWLDIRFDAARFFIFPVLIAMVAFAEELVFRGYILNNLLQSMNKWLALAFSAIVFAVFHSSNPSANPVALLNIFAGGLLLGVNYIYTRNLWFGILFHFAWNFYQGPVLGYPVSGLHIYSLLENEVTGKPYISGGEFGFEGSVICGILSLGGVCLLSWIYERKFAAAKQRVAE